MNLIQGTVLSGVGVSVSFSHSAMLEEALMILDIKHVETSVQASCLIMANVELGVSRSVVNQDYRLVLLTRLTNDGSAGLGRMVLSITGMTPVGLSH